MAESERHLPESGLFTETLHFGREEITGQVPSDPDYLLYSDNVVEWSVTPGLNLEPRHGVGSPDPNAHDTGGVEPELMVTYDLQRPLIDGSGEYEDASADAFDRTDSNTIPYTHHVRIVEGRSHPDPDDPDGTSGVRNFTIGKGCHPNVETEMDPEEGRPIRPIVTYMCEKVREYQVYQPDGDMLSITLGNTDDTGITVTIEDDAGNSEEVDMASESVTTTKDDWNSISALSLSDETVGDVTVAADGGSDLATIRGAEFYGKGGETLEGDLGIPAVGEGALESNVDNEYVFFHGASVTRGGEPLDYDLNRIGVTVENQYEGFPRQNSDRQRWSEGNRDLQIEADVIGWGASVDFYQEAVGLVNEDIVIELTTTQFTFHDAVPVEPGDKERASDDTAIEYSVVFQTQGDGITIANNE